MFSVYAAMDQRMRLSRVGDFARRVEGLGYDGLCVPEAVHDGLLAAGAALAATGRLRVATSVLVAFPRSPMTVAHAAWDLQESSGGRFQLGLGSQVRGNVVGRYSTPWTPPVPRMREYVNALRAIFRTWQDREPLRFEGELYSFTRMQPFFDPGPLPSGPPPVLLGAVGPAMTSLAGEVADGLATHPTHSAPRYLREVTLPRVAKGAARTGRAAGSTPLLVSPLVATGPDERAARAEREKARQLLAFLYSTPAYARSLSFFGFGDLGGRLHALSREGRWSDMPDLIGDELLDALVPTATHAEIADLLRDRFAGICHWIAFPVPEDPAHDASAARAIQELRKG